MKRTSILIVAAILACTGAAAQEIQQFDVPEQQASLAAHKAVLDDVRRRVHQKTAGVPLNRS